MIRNAPMELRMEPVKGVGIKFDALLTAAVHFNIDRDQGDDPINLTEMATILGVDCGVDLTLYDGCVDGSECADCTEKSCQVYLR